MHTQMDYIVLRDLDRRLADTQNTLDRNLGAIRSESQLYRQDMTFRLNGMAKDIRKIREAVARLEARAAKPTIDIVALWQNMSLWIKVAILLALGASNKELLALVSASLGN